MAEEQEATTSKHTGSQISYTDDNFHPISSSELISMHDDQYVCKALALLIPDHTHW